MLLTTLLFAAVIQCGSSASFSKQNSWALLVAGSKGYNNYRHQADVSHAYHVMLASGFPSNRIILMMYDDIAHHKENPRPGVIINHPKGPNVYQGLNIDYRGKDVNKNNFLNVLTGNAANISGVGSGRVIQSDENSNIFLFFVDHGGPGILCFPNEVLSAVQLENTLTWMYANKLYNKVIMYIEACYSGSMFDNILQENTNVFVMTAAARDESSFGVFCNEGTCLGDEFSVRWMEHMDSFHGGNFETFFHQYQTIRSSVKKSHVQLYGDLSVGDEQTPLEAATPSVLSQFWTWVSGCCGFGNVRSKNYTFSRPSEDIGFVEEIVIDSKDVALYSLSHQASHPNKTLADLAHIEMTKLVQGRRTVTDAVDELVSVAVARSPHLWSTICNKQLTLHKDMFPCYMELLDHFRKHCFGAEHEYSIHEYHKFANICVLGLDTSTLLDVMPALCDPYRKSVLGAVL